MSHVHYGICDLCDSICGLEIEYEDRKIISIRGDKKDPFSRGHICPKGIASQDIYNDPDRLRQPMIRNGDKWTKITWEQGLKEAGQRIASIQQKYGKDALGLYYGTPPTHNYGHCYPSCPL